MKADLGADEALIQFLYLAPVGLVQTGHDGTVEFMNPTAAQLLMPLAQDGSLDNLFAIFARSAPQLPAVARSLIDIGDGPGTALRVALPPGAGQAPRVLSLHLLRLDDSRLMAVVADVTLQVQAEERERRLAETRLHVAARTDALTQMPNRAELRERIARLLPSEPGASAARFGLLFLNADRFRHINDRLGPTVGDGLLGLLAARLRSVLRAGQTEVARIGGDEFAVLMQGLGSDDDAIAIATRVIEALRRPYQYEGHTLTCTASGGLVLSTQGEASSARRTSVENADALLRDASVAMVEAKRRGGARLVPFEPAMRDRAMQRGTVEADLRDAISAGELFVVYQPIVALHSSPAGAVPQPRCLGVEALVRWRHPRRGVVPPSDFITIAEECGLIAALGEFVLTTATDQLHRWQQTLGPLAPGWVAVNLSRAQLRQAGFVDTVASTLAANALPAACLHLEVTESLAAQDEAVRAVLQELRALGVTLALDDFGTGYSSLSSLHHFPVEVVKIDRSFTEQVDTSEHHRVLVQATVLVARSLGMRTVVEGIETASQAQRVQALGCDEGQGYFYSRPLDCRAMSDWLVAPGLT